MVFNAAFVYNTWSCISTIHYNFQFSSLEIPFFMKIPSVCHILWTMDMYKVVELWPGIEERPIWYKEIIIIGLLEDNMNWNLLWSLQFHVFKRQESVIWGAWMLQLGVFRRKERVIWWESGWRGDLKGFSWDNLCFVIVSVFIWKSFLWCNNLCMACKEVMEFYIHVL